MKKCFITAGMLLTLLMVTRVATAQQSTSRQDMSKASLDEQRAYVQKAAMAKRAEMKAWYHKRAENGNGGTTAGCGASISVDQYMEERQRRGGVKLLPGEIKATEPRRQ